MSAPARSLPQATRPEAPASDDILRFRESERRLHWALAVPFMVCYTTALILVLVYNPSPLRPFRAVFSWAHRISGVCLFVLPLWTIARHRREFTIHWQNILEAWLWRLDDVKWLFLMGPSTLNKKISLPDSGKFNAAEKINFMMLNCTYPFYIVTGFLIWLPGVAYLSWLVHLSMAAVATPLILGHVFMATVNPDTRVGLSGMISGFVNRHWARHHYRRWYDENFAPCVAPAARAANVAPAQPRPVEILHRPSLGGLSVASWPPLRQAAVGTGLVPRQRVDADMAGASALAMSEGQGGILRELEMDDPSLMAEDHETPAARWPQVREQAPWATIVRTLPPDRPVLQAGSLVCE